ncbi:MAG: helix-turn-helix transcriptional regulator [bacterium]|nr:helix-turn-helix transcriptional regulator [bacterium]
MMAIDVYSILLVATITQGTLLVFALLSSKQSNKTANYLLSGLIVLFSYYTLVKILCNTDKILHYPHFIRTYPPVFVLACAVVYFYSKALLTPGFRFTCKECLHLVPFGMYTLLLLPFYFSDPATKIAYLSPQTITLSWVLDLMFYNIACFFYFGLSYRTVRRHQRHIKDVFSNLEKVKLDWLRNLLLAFGMIWVTALLRMLTSFTGVGYEITFLTPLLLCLTIYLIGWYALRQPEIFKDFSKEIDGARHRKPVKVDVMDTQDAAPFLRSEPRPKYEYSSLTSQDIVGYKEKLLTYLEQDKPYTDNELKVQDLAERLGIASYQLSQVINTELQRNFYDLINSYRIEEAKQRLTDPGNQHFTILAIAYDVGFNSKSTFNTAFKKYTNMTPSQYKKSQMVMAHS